MNRIEELRERLRGRVPSVEAELDPPATPTAPWFLDVRLGKSAVIVEWRPALGFGVSSVQGGLYGDASPDEFFPHLDGAVDRVVELLTQGKRTAPPARLDLKAMRERRFVTQEELAALVGVKQGTISKLERRGAEEVGIGVLRSVARALGGELEVNVRFAERSVAVVLNSERPDDQEPPSVRGWK
jgi:DNA-binding XRE family transcriptional regulator